MPDVDTLDYEFFSKVDRLDQAFDEHYSYESRIEQQLQDRAFMTDLRLELSNLA